MQKSRIKRPSASQGTLGVFQKSARSGNTALEVWPSEGRKNG